jgi:hypothetical protein
MQEIFKYCGIYMFVEFISGTVIVKEIDTEDCSIRDAADG